MTSDRRDLISDRYNPDTSSVTGGPYRVTSALSDDITGVALARTTGAMAFAASTRIPQVRSYPLDSSGRRIIDPPGVVLTSSATESNSPHITPDGKRIVFMVRRPGGRQGWELRRRTRQMVIVDGAIPRTAERHARKGRQHATELEHRQHR